MYTYLRTFESREKFIFKHNKKSRFRMPYLLCLLLKTENSFSVEIV